MHFLGHVRAQVGNECVCSFEKLLVPVSGLFQVLLSVQMAPKHCALCVLVFQWLCSKGWSSPLHWCHEVAAVRTERELVQPVCCLRSCLQLDGHGARFTPAKGPGPMWTVTCPVQCQCPLTVFLEAGQKASEHTAAF